VFLIARINYLNTKRIIDASVIVVLVESLLEIYKNFEDVFNKKKINK
jgi:hypothetical protein